MSDTPRTDAAFAEHGKITFQGEKYVMAEFAQELERENSALREDCKIIDELCVLHGCSMEFLVIWCRAAIDSERRKNKRKLARKEAQP